MNTPNESSDSGELIAKILREARDEAEKITAEAQASVAERRLALEKRVAQISQAADERTAAEATRLRKRADAAIALLEGRAGLRREDRIYRSASDRTLDAVAELRSTDGYVDLLARWIAEAAAGLGAAEAIVTCPIPDRPYLARAVVSAQGFLDGSGVTVRLRADEERAELGQGVVLRDSAGRRAFSNLVEDRLRRFGSELSRIVFHAVIEE